MDQINVFDVEFTVPESVIIHLNQLNAAMLAFEGQVNARADSPMVQISDNKCEILDDCEVIVRTDYYLINEFREAVDNSIEMVWSVFLEPGDIPPNSAIVEVIESLPPEMQPFTFPLVRFNDPMLLQIINAYTLDVLKLDYVYTKYCKQSLSYKTYGLYNAQWIAKPKTIQSLELRRIVNNVKNIAKNLINDCKDRSITKKDAMVMAWQNPEILAQIAEYKRQKQQSEDAKKEFIELFKSALADPDSLFRDDFESGCEGGSGYEGSRTILNEQDESIAQAMAAVERALNAVEEEELTKLTSVGDECI